MEEVEGLDAEDLPVGCGLMIMMLILYERGWVWLMTLFGDLSRDEEEASDREK